MSNTCSGTVFDGTQAEYEIQPRNQAWTPALRASTLKRLARIYW
jgi:hypothetical protein